MGAVVRENRIRQKSLLATHKMRGRRREPGVCWLWDRAGEQSRGGREADSQLLLTPNSSCMWSFLPLPQHRNPPSRTEGIQVPFLLLLSLSALSIRPGCRSFVMHITDIFPQGKAPLLGCCPHALLLMIREVQLPFYAQRGSASVLYR